MIWGVIQDSQKMQSGITDDDVNAEWTEMIRLIKMAKRQKFQTLGENDSKIFLVFYNIKSTHWVNLSIIKTKRIEK